MGFCSAVECGRKIYARGWCDKHYKQNRLAACHPREAYKNEKYSPVCSVVGCEKPHRSRGFCNKHLRRWMTHGDPLATAHSREYGSGKEWHEGPIGYVARFEPANPNAGPNGQVYQHRHVMSEMIGRPLQSNENVHHINGDRADNRPENLELWDKPQPPGQRVTERVEWCIEYLSGDALPAALKLKPELAEALAKLALKLK